MDDSPPDDLLTWDDLMYLVDFLETSNERHVSLLGGEPTLHPDFVSFVRYLLERQFHVNVFTSGVLSQRRFADMERQLGRAPQDRLSFVVNANDPQLSPPKELQKVREFLRTFGHLSSLGFNIYRVDFDIDFLFEYVNLFGTQRHVRLGLAHPIPGEVNVFIDPADIRTVAERLISYLPMFKAFRVSPGFDCGFPMCQFTETELGELFKVSRGNLKFGCGPAIDIGPDMTVWPCFPLSNVRRKSIYEFNSLHEVRGFFEDFHRKARVESSGLFLDCDTCRLRTEGLCAGGCVAHSLAKFGNEEHVRVKEMYE
jgi:radical SAM protein with 4Fe4S-binding SPASM domain